MLFVLAEHSCMSPSQFFLAYKNPQVIDVDNGDVITTAGKSGELLIKTPAVFKGYLNRPDLTSQVLDDEGFYHSGKKLIHGRIQDYP